MAVENDVEELIDEGNYRDTFNKETWNSVLSIWSVNTPPSIVQHLGGILSNKGLDDYGIISLIFQY